MRNSPILHSVVRRHGFTSVELLVVVAIILIVAALLYPALARLSDMGKSIKCVENLKNIDVLIKAYLGDHNGWLPWYDARSGMRGMWWYKLQEQNGLSDKEFSKLFSCPSFHELPPAYPSDPGRVFTYIYNKKLGYHEPANAPNTKWVYPQVNLLAVTNASKVPLMADSFKDPELAGSVNGSRGDASAGFENWRQVYAAHGRRAYGNVLMLDGHLERVYRPLEGINHPNAKVPLNFSAEFIPTY